MRWPAALFSLAFAFVVGSTAVSAQAPDTDKARAKKAFESGVAAYESKRYEDALSHFQEAQRLAPHPIVQVNIANCYDKLDRPVEAIHHFETFLESGVAGAAQREEVTRALKRLRGQVGRILFQVRPDGTRVVLDGIELAHTPIAAPVVVTAGKHTVDLTRDGYLAATRHVELGPGGVQHVEVTLEPAPTPAPAPIAVAPGGPAVEPAPAHAPAYASEPESASRDAGGIPLAVWISGGATAAVLVSAAVTGLLALDAETDFENARSLRYSTATELTASGRLRAYNDAVDAATRAQNLALATDILLGAAVVGAGLTVYLYLTQRQSDSALLVTPALAHGAAGATVRASW